jgi:CRISPR-associated protein Csb3
MAEASIPVDLFNPGQVFACFGFLEAAIVLLGDAEALFDWREPQARFRIRAPGDESPVAHVLGFLGGANAISEAPAGSPNIESWKRPWGEPPRATPRERGYPIPDPSSPATLICVLEDAAGRRLAIDHWGDTQRDNVKFWAGAAGKPGTAFVREALELVRDKATDAAADPFNLPSRRSSSFRFDWRGDYIPIDTGFSLNNHGDAFSSQGYPLIDLLAAMGLTHARPQRPEPRNKLIYRYAVVGDDGSASTPLLRAPLLRASIGGAELPFPTRRFRMLLSWPGQENQARVITTVTEES